LNLMQPPTATLFPYTTLFRSRQNGALCTTASSDAANEAFSSTVNGFAASFTTPVRPLDIIDAGRRANEPCWSVRSSASAKPAEAVPTTRRTARIVAALRDILFSLAQGAFVP